MGSGDLSNYFHTIRHLKVQQVIARIGYSLRRPHLDFRPAPEIRAPVCSWKVPAARQPSMVGPACFEFLSQRLKLASSDDWAAVTSDRLWLYNLHYFDDLNARAAADRTGWHRDLISQWLGQNPPGVGVGWEPFPLSLRTINWIKWILSGHPPTGEMVQSLAVQFRFLRRRLETHLLGNHLLANAKALVFGGLFFGDAEASEWLEKGMALLAREIPEQVLGDGGHFERSPMYHSIILEDLLDLINLYRTYGHREMETSLLPAAEDMAHWLSAMCHGDGKIALFNDAAFDIAPSPSELLRYATSLGLRTRPVGDRLTPMSESGYARLQRDAVVALVDVGPVGPDYMLGHGHADTLSFELSNGEQRIIVDSGTSLYGDCPERVRQRGTRAHNTVMVDGYDSSEVWRSHRVARRARISELRAADGGDSISVGASHDGYRRLGRVGLHRRTWTMDAHGLTILDEIGGSGLHTVELLFHLHPDVEAHLDDGAARLHTTGRRALGSLHLDPALEMKIIDSTYHPRFGVCQANRVIVGKRDGELPVRLISRIRLESDR